MRSTATRKKVQAPPAPEPAAAPPAPATSEREKALALWEKAQPGLQKKQAAEEAELRAAETKVREDEGWAAGELAMLRRRTVSAYEDVDLGNGDTIRIRTGLTEPEFDTLVDLDAAEYWIRKTAVAETRILTPEEHDRIDEIVRAKIAYVTANPRITATWLRENKADFPFMDVINAYRRVIPLIQEMERKPENAAKFRADPAR